MQRSDGYQYDGYNPRAIKFVPETPFFTEDIIVAKADLVLPYFVSFRLRDSTLDIIFVL